MVLRLMSVWLNDAIQVRSPTQDKGLGYKNVMVVFDPCLQRDTYGQQRVVQKIQRQHGTQQFGDRTAFGRRG